MLDRLTRPFHKFATVRRSMRHYAGTCGAAPRRQIGEMTRLWVRNGIGPLEYYVLGLFRPTVPWEEKLNTISNDEYWDLIQAINPPELRAIASNKLASYGMLRSFGIPTPAIHGVFGPSGTTTGGAALTTPADLSVLAAQRSLREVCLKPFSSWSGRGFVKVCFDANDPGRVTVLPDGPVVSVAELTRNHLSSGVGAFLVQEAVAQHPDVARFHPPSVNTMRVWMLQHEEGVWDMGPANLRIGVGGSVVDNTSAGGIGAAIDVDTGRLSAALIRGLDPDNGVYLQEYPAHPTTGETIEGAMLPMWEEARKLCRRTCAVFPFFGLMGLDVAFGVDQPWIIEVEADPHSVIQVYVGRGVKRDVRALARRARRRQGT